MRKQTTLDKIDSWFESKGSSANTYLVLALLVAGALAYLALSTGAQEYFDNEQSRLNKATQNLNEATNSLNAFGPLGDGTYSQIKNKEVVLKGEKARLNETIDSNQYVDNKLREVSNVTYNRENWAEFLDSLTEMAVKSNVKVFAITSEEKDIDQKTLVLEPQAMLDVGVVMEGTYHNVLRYINAIEESKMIVDVNKLDINKSSTDGKIGGSIGISIWGVRYQ
ncbi:MAG: hypothetical protein J6M21_03195 [Campylobacter sp.]|nr:hypothetical protein [Campylobacter sp.]MBP3725083.1 hypothetical protein [Campylobacter sp.]